MGRLPFLLFRAWRRPVCASVARFLRGEHGDEGVSKILIIALVAIPLVLVLVLFGQELLELLIGAESDAEHHPLVPYGNPFK